MVDDAAPDVPRPADLQDQPGDEQQIADQSREDGHPNQRAIPLDAEDVDHRGHDEAARRQADPGEDVEPDPDAPRRLVAEVGHRAEAEGETDGDDDGGHRQQQRHQHPPRGQRRSKALNHGDLLSRRRGGPSPDRSRPPRPPRDGGTASTTPRGTRRRAGPRWARASAGAR